MDGELVEIKHDDRYCINISDSLPNDSQYFNYELFENLTDENWDTDNINYTEYSNPQSGNSSTNHD